jgi:transcriptional regulator with XRE-family HTH domain
MDILTPGACRDARVKQGLTQLELADKLGVSQALISRFESGRHTPAAEVLVSLDRMLSKVPDPFVRQVKFPAELSKRAVRELEGAAGRVDNHGKQTIVTMRGATLIELLDRLRAYSQIMCVIGECEHCGKPTPLGTLKEQP